MARALFLERFGKTSRIKVSKLVPPLSRTKREVENFTQRRTRKGNNKMKFLFIDETLDSANVHYLGVCGVLIDSSKYGEMKREYLSKIAKYGWDPSIEFKGTMIFSSSQGCPSVSVEKRIELVRDLVSMNTSTSNSRIKFCYAYTTSGSTTRSYLDLVSTVTSKILEPSITTKNGKDVVSICVDQRSDIKTSDLRSVIDPIIAKKKALLFEDVIQSKSSTYTMGIFFADIIGYLLARKDNLSVSCRILEEADPEVRRTNGQIRKLLASTEIVGMIKSIRIIPIMGTIDASSNGTINRTVRSITNMASQRK
jgi:hypothetical protein